MSLPAVAEELCVHVGAHLYCSSRQVTILTPSPVSATGPSQVFECLHSPAHVHGFLDSAEYISTLQSPLWTYSLDFLLIKLFG